MVLQDPRGLRAMQARLAKAFTLVVCMERFSGKPSGRADADTRPPLPYDARRTALKTPENAGK